MVKFQRNTISSCVLPFPLTTICSVLQVSENRFRQYILQKRWLKYLGNMLVAEGSILIPLKSPAEFPFNLTRSKIEGWILQALFKQN